MSEVKRYHVTEAGLVEGQALGRINVVLGADFDRVTAGLASANSDREAYAQNAIDLRKRVDALQQRLTAADERADVLEGALRTSLLAMKRIYQAGYDRIIEAGGTCDTPEYMMAQDPTTRDLRALLVAKPETVAGHHPACRAVDDYKPGDCSHSCKPASQPQGEPVTIEAVAVTRDNGDGSLRLEWLLEGGIAQMEFAGMVLFAIPEANELCDEDGSAEVYLTPPQAEQPAPVAVDVLNTGFYTTESGGGKYAISIGFRSMADMQAADAQLRDLLKSR
ncbi:hypothetical protein MOQ67_05145 [Pseudomonas sp. LY-1]